MLTFKDELELNYWKGSSATWGEYHRAKISLYLWAFGCFRLPDSVLEIGTGPFGGVLPLIPSAKLRIGVDPLYDQYRSCGLLNQASSVQLETAHFEDWDSRGRQFDAIFSIDSLDHGGMGFHLLPKVASLLAPGGRFYLFVHLRPKHLLNEIHDHALSLGDLSAEIRKTGLAELKLEIIPHDLDKSFTNYPCLIGVWESPSPE